MTLTHGGEIYDKRIELDFSVNLNPNPCPEEVHKAIREASLHVSEYPDITQKSFRQKVALAENKLSGSDWLTPENVIGGNGASELIMAIIRLINPKKVLMPVPAFYGYYHGIRACGNIEVERYLLSEEKDFALGEEFLEHITEGVDLVILGNPNNPTGRVVDERLLEDIVYKCNETGTALLIDECFLNLSTGSFSAARYLDDCNNLFIVNAYTKLFSIPGVRVGYALAGKESIRALTALLPEWNMSVMAQRAGEACADIIVKTDFVDISKEYIKKLREQMIRYFGGLEIKVYPSDTNFILVRSSKRLYDFFLSKEILIRDCGEFEGLEKGYYRIAVKDEASYERMKQCFCSLT